MIDALLACLPHWSRPGWFFAWPLLAWLCWGLWLRRRRSGRWQALLPRAFHGTLLRGSQARAQHWPRVLLAMAAVLAGLALAGPGWQRDQPLSQRPDDPLVILLALTPDMLARDVSPDRLSQARRKILDVLQRRAEAQTAIVVYAGSAHTLVPLSDDQATSANLLEALRPSLMPEPGQRADLAVRQGLDLLAQAGQGPGRLLLIASSLNDEERAGIDHWLGRRAPPLLILGVGTPEGAAVPQENGELLKDPRGGIALARLDVDALTATAASAHGRYETARIDSHDLHALGMLDGGHGSFGADAALASPSDRWADQGYWLLLPLLGLAALAGRRGWLLCLPLWLALGATPSPVYAFSLADFWLRPDQQGQRLLTRAPDEAAARFSDPRWQGVALYRAQQYAEAAKRFAQGDSAADHYNRGNALAMSGKLESALDAYEQALERDPALSIARDNQALVRSMLQARQASVPGTPPSAPSAPAKEPPAASSSPSGPSPGPGVPSAAMPPAHPATTTTDSPASTTSSPAPSATVDGNKDDRLGNHTGALEASASQNNGPVLERYPEDEARQSLEQWLRQIPDDPSELLRRKFWYEQRQRQEQ